MNQHNASLAEQGSHDVLGRIESAGAGRRRLRRLDHGNPTSILPLRGALTPGLPLNGGADPTPDRGVLAPSDGIVVSIVLSALLWAAISFVGWAILH